MTEITKLSDEELATQAAQDMHNREEEIHVLDAENRKLRRENRELIHKLNQALS